MVTKVLGPKTVCIYVPGGPSDGWSPHVVLGLDPAVDRIKFICGQGAPAAGVMSYGNHAITNWSVANAEFTSRIHPAGSDLTAWPGDPTKVTDLYKGRWGIQVHGLLPDPNTGEMPEISGCHFRWISQEHGAYSMGACSSRNNYYDHCAAQGFQLINYAIHPKDPADPSADMPPDWRDYTGPHLEVGSYGDRYEYCGLQHGVSRAAFACSIKAGLEGAVVADGVFTHDHHPAGGGWLNWQGTKKPGASGPLAEPGAILIQDRPRADIRRCAINYKGMSNRPVILVQRVSGLTRLRKNVAFGFGGTILIEMGEVQGHMVGDVVIEGSTFTGTGAPPQVSVRSHDGVELYSGPVTDPWTT